MNNKISNPKTEVPTGIALNDKDFITALSTCLKELSKNYTVAQTEASNEVLYNKYHLMYIKLINMQREVYELMFRKGWYSIEKAETQKISDKFQMLSQEYKDLNLN